MERGDVLTDVSAFNSLFGIQSAKGSMLFIHLSDFQLPFRDSEIRGTGAATPQLAFNSLFGIQGFRRQELPAGA